MHLSTIFLSATLAPFAMAQTSCGGDKSKKGYCTPLEYVDRTGSGSPSSEQCLDTCRSINSDAGDWGVDFNGKPDGYIDHMLHHDCGFSVTRLQGDTSDSSFLMHNQDILDLIDESINKFGGTHGGNVGAEGTMMCDGRKYKWIID